MTSPRVEPSAPQRADHEPVADRAVAPTPTDATPLVLRDEVADLDRRARAGDAAAACRLAAELLACERARSFQPYAVDIETQARLAAQQGMPQEAVDRQIDAALQRQVQTDAVVAHCEGVELEHWPPVARYFGMAAQAGHRPSMLQFLNAERFRADQLFRDPDLIPLFRSNAPRFFEQLMQSGDFDLLQRWAASASMPHDILYGTLPPPWNERGFAVAMLHQSLQARGLTPPETSVLRPTPAQEQEAAELYLRYFGTRQPELNSAIARAGASPYSLAQYRCDDAVTRTRP